MYELSEENMFMFCASKQLGTNHKLSSTRTHRGLKHMFKPLLGEMIQFDEHIFGTVVEITNNKVGPYQF